jgi:hypothetical protein
VLHLNRLFSSDGLGAIRRFERSVRRYGERGLATEVQLRYHPRPADEGDIGRFRRFVRQAVVRLARHETFVGLTVTNEVNFPVSPNTSDGSYEGARAALVAGVIEADRVLRRIDRRDVEVGFTFAWRYLPDSDLRFWRELGRIGGKRFARVLDYVGLQIYPGLVWPPLPLPGRSAGTEVVDALALLRHCYMPLAGLGRRTGLWVTENGYPTNLGRSEPGQARELRSTLDAVRSVSGTLGVGDYRYFNLRDNDSGGLDLFAAVGLLRDDYSPKPAFDVLAREIRAHGVH